jgi:hypothetical protein
MSNQVINGLIEKLYNKDYGLLILVCLLPILIVGLLCLFLFEWIDKQNVIKTPEWLSLLVIKCSIILFQISIELSIQLYDPIQNAIEYIIDIYSKLEVNSLLNYCKL